MNEEWRMYEVCETWMGKPEWPPKPWQVCPCHASFHSLCNESLKTGLAVNVKYVWTFSCIKKKTFTIFILVCSHCCYCCYCWDQFNIKLQPKLIELIFPLTLHQNRKLKLLFLIKRRTFGHFHIRVFSEHFFCWHHVWSQQFVFIGAEWDSNGQDRNTYEVRRHQSTAFLQAPATDSARTGIRRSRTLVCLRRRPQGRVHEFKRNRKRIRRVCHISPVKQWGGSYVHYVRSNWSAFTVCHCTA